MSKVIVALDREEAELLARFTAGALIGSPTRTLNGPVHAALDRDPDELVEQVARTLYVAQLTGGSYFWKDLPNQEPWRKQARAALAAITGEGKD